MESTSMFVNRLQTLLFNEKLAHGSPHDKADLLRCVISHLNCGVSDDVSLPEESVNLALRSYEDRYAAIVDSYDENSGLNNYAEGALALCSRHKNDSQKWKSSLTIDRVMEMDCVRQLQADNKIVSDRILPPSQADKLLPSCLSKPKPKESGFSSNTRPQTSCFNGSRTLQSGFAGSYGNANLPYNQQSGISHTVQSSCSHGVSDAWNEENSNRRKPLFSGGVGKQAGVLNDAPPGFYRKEVGAMKRPHMEEGTDLPEEAAMGPPIGGCFRTAKQQLAIESQKKFSRDRGQVTTSSYTSRTVKKSLGTRRGPSSAFVPPVINRDDESSVTMNAVQRSVVGRQSTSGGGRDDEPVDERLKGIEPKMIELISNEIMDHGPQMDWNDIAGLEFAKKTIKEIVVWPMLRPDIFTGLRGPPKGLLLFGPPGTGKTLIGKCIASQSKSTFFSISASSLTSKWVGEGEKMVRALFAVSRCNQPAVVFIDEIDSLLSQRSDGENEASRRIKTEFLVQLDGAATVTEDRILVIGATNRPQEIDEAARRRFVKRLYIPLPESPARRQIVLNLLSEQSFQLTDEEIDAICQRSSGYSGADMANLCREAALGPIRSLSMDDIESITAEQVRPIIYTDFDAAFSQVRASVSQKRFGFVSGLEQNVWQW
ncbi:hypothetical protein ScPMuIL_004688 [Solemya velum]